MYNTLGLICWRLTKNGDLEGARYVQALAQFCRIGLNQGNALIALEQELRHVQLYVEIQNFRLDGAIALQITLPQALKDIRVPGNTPQPLVENSIVAGILEKPGGRGSVQISCAPGRKRILRSLISDDGVGVDIPAMVESVLNQRSDSHYGIWNVKPAPPPDLWGAGRAGLQHQRGGRRGCVGAHTAGLKVWVYL